MDNSQSGLCERMVEEKLVEQLNAMHLKHRIRQQEVEKEYVRVDFQDSPPAYPEGSQVVSIDAAKQWEKELLEDPKNRLALAALMSNPLPSIVSQKVATLADRQTFNIKVPLEGSPVTNQKSSGRCWLFAATNVFRVAIMKKHNLKEFELSQAYLFFWDKLEKANYFLEQIIDTAGESLDSRLVQEILKAPVSDGGQWDMVANLVTKYGLVPQVLYPDSYNAMNSSAMDSILTNKLREDALALWTIVNSKYTNRESVLAHAKAKMMQEVHRILTLMLGPPPKPDQKFSWDYYDANDKYHKVSKTPLELAKELSAPAFTRSVGGANVNELFSLVNDPRNPYGQLLTVDRLGNVFGGRPVRYVNVDIDIMKKAAISMLEAGLPAFFGSDVGKFSDSQSGIMDPALYDYSLAFDISFKMDKSERLRVGASAATHAMVLTAVQVEDGRSVRWRVQNSWGESAGEKGFFVMADSWMDEYVYQVVVDPSFVSQEVRDILRTKPHILPLWDPMGVLA